MGEVNRFYKFSVEAACLLLSISISHAHYADDAPQIRCESVPNAVQSGCEDALILAQAMYQAQSFVFYAPLTLPDALKSEFILGNIPVDISGGNEISFSSDFFSPYPQIETPYRRVFWGNSAAV